MAKAYISCFNPDPGETYTEDASALDDKVRTLLAPVFTEYIKKGYSARELHFIFVGAVWDLVSMQCLLAAYDARKGANK